MPDLNKMSDDDLDEILRRAENVDVPGSLHQRALIERQIRDRKERKGSVGIRMRNSSGTISNSRFRNLDTAIDAENSSLISKSNTFENEAPIKTRPSFLDKFFWPLLVAILGTLLVAPVIYFFGWN